MGNIKRFKNMSQENATARHQECNLLPDGAPDGCAVISAESSLQKVSLQKRKEDAKKMLYINRV